MKRNTVYLTDISDIVEDLNNVAFKETGRVDVAFSDDGSVGIYVSDPIGNNIYYDDDLSPTQALYMVRGMLHGIMILQGKDI